MSQTTCPICGSARARELFTTIVQCSQCGLVRTQWEAVTADRLYDSSYFTERNQYLAEEAAFSAMFEELITLTQHYKPSGQLLDVGCGPGLLLKVARQHGYQVRGCDIATWATQYARDNGLDVQTGELESIHYPDREFDVVALNHALEHVRQPIELLREIRRILKEDGIVVVGVPNFDSLMAHMMRRRWAGLLPDQHLWHFTPRTLRWILERADFSVRTLIVQPSSHQHSNWIKQLILNALTFLGNSLQRGEVMVAVASKN
jgi:2-polyprenyl-3-methyl-5-hydroxy-6-metoxy-1,4-benzoquinol methylase